MKEGKKIKDYRKELGDQLLEIRELIKKSNRNLVKYKDLPDSHVYISNSNGCPQYYLKQGSGPRKYVSKNDIKDISKYAQRDYEAGMNKKLRRLEAKLKGFLETYDPGVVSEYENYSDAKKAIIKPLIMTEKEYIERWYTEHPGQQNPYPYGDALPTNRGENVRSKSEKIIADALDKFKVPYQYEPMLELGYSTVYPDFVTLNLRTKRTVYWEHLGIVSDLEYATKNFSKIQIYEREGFLLGKDLITTMESSDRILDVRLVEKKIKEFLL